MEQITKNLRREGLRRIGLSSFEIEVLRYLVENRFTTMKAIEGKFWNGKAHRNHYRKLQALRERGFIEPLVGDGGFRLGYRPTRKAIYHLKASGLQPGKLTDLQSEFRSTFDHDKILLELRNVLETSPLVSDFLPEHRVREVLSEKYGYRPDQGNGYKIPDGMFYLKTAKRKFRVALELELTMKSKNRYVKLMKQLSLSRDWDVIFIISKDKVLKQKMEGILSAVRKSDYDIKLSKLNHGIYFATLSEFLSFKLECPLAGENKTFSLAGLADEIQISNQK